jgi:hypothetical protein
MEARVADKPGNLNTVSQFGIRAGFETERVGCVWNSAQAIIIYKAKERIHEI